MNSIEKAIEKLMGQKSAAVNRQSNVLANKANKSVHDAVTSGSKNLLHFDMDKLKELGYVTQQDPNSTLSEEFRIIKRPVLRNIAGQGAEHIDMANLVMVTSSLPGEGKTFMTLNLALSMVAEKDTTVLLIDCDVVNPTMSRMLGLSTTKGLTDILTGNSNSLEEVIYTTDIPNLKFIPAGHLDSHSTELLASERMHQLTNELATRYEDRIILFDSPPLLVTSQAAVLSHLMGQIMVVVEAGNTPQRAVHDAIELLDEKSVIGLILNKNRKSSLGGYYYGSYYAKNEHK